MRLTLEELIPRYQNELFRAAFAVCKNASEAEDAVQDTFFRYYRDRAQFESEEHLRAWLLRVAINRSRDALRSAWWKKRASLDEYVEGLPLETPEDGRVLKAVLALPRKYREAVFLFYYEGFSVREIAGILRLKESTVKSHLRRARIMLKEELQEEWNEYES